MCLCPQLQRPSDQEVQDFLTQEDLDGRRRRSLHVRTAPGSDPLNGRRSSLKEPPEVEPPPSLLLAPLKQFVSQSQKALEGLSATAPENAAR